MMGAGLTAQLVSNDAPCLRELHQLQLGRVRPDAFVLSGVEERFERRSKQATLRRQSWLVTLRDLPLSLVQLRDRGRRRTMEECKLQAPVQGVVVVSRRRPTATSAFETIFYDPDKSAKLGRLDNVSLRRINHRGIVLRGDENLAGPRDSRPSPQAWWLMPAAEPVEATLTEDMEEERQQLVEAQVLGDLEGQIG
jgi:hypothetical protein